MDEKGNPHKSRLVLFIGGKKHGSSMYIPEGQNEYELVESTILCGVDYSKNDERYQGNIYKHDSALSATLGRPVFTHNVINGHDHGSSLLPELVKAHGKIESLDAAWKREQETSKELRGEVGDLSADMIELRSTIREQDQRLSDIRILLEQAATGIVGAAVRTGRDYKSIVVQAEPV